MDREQRRLVREEKVLQLEINELEEKIRNLSKT